MIFDLQNLFAEGQAITATAISTNVIQWGAMGSTFQGSTLLREIGDGDPIKMAVQVNETFDNLTSLAITLEQADNAALSSSADVLWSHSALLAELVAGYQVPITVLPKRITQEYLGLRFTVTGTNPAAGQITAGIVAGVGTMVNAI